VYREWPSSMSGVIAWTAESDGTPGRVLPDGCMDLLWIGGHLVVAGPDRTSFLTTYPPGSRYAGLRFAPGLAPSLFGVPAHAVRDERVPLDALWTRAEVVRLEEQVASSPNAVDGLEAVVAGHARGPAEVDPVLAEVVRRARRGDWVATIAPAIGLSTRQLQRRALDAFGYGPKLLTRILRLGDALALARRGVPLAAVAAHCGYADQAHLADDVRALAGTTLGQLGLGARAQSPGAGAGSAANRSTGLPSGSLIVA
jgi:AraC-like DNA-binding protein